MEGILTMRRRVRKDETGTLKILLPLFSQLVSLVDFLLYWREIE